MLRRLFRLLIIGLILAVIAYVASRLLGGEEDDFDDFDDLDSEFEFQETPVEIDVPANDPATLAPTTPSATNASTTATPSATSANQVTDTMSTGRLNDTEASPESAPAGRMADGGRLIDIVGIGPAYEARLHSIGINSIHDLASADAEMIASQIEVIGGAATVGEWIDQARSHQGSGQS